MQQALLSVTGKYFLSGFGFGLPILLSGLTSGFVAAVVFAVFVSPQCQMTRLLYQLRVV